MEHMLTVSTEDKALMDVVEAEWFRLGFQMDDFRDEQHVATAKALVLAWKRCRLADFLDQYEILMVEDEIEVQLAPNLILQARADCVTRDRMTGVVQVWNWKTTSSIQNWSDQWIFDIQAMTEALAVQEALGEYVQGCIFEGFFKGGFYGGVSTSPLLTGYTDGAAWEVGGKPRKGDWEKISTWKEFPGGTPLWLDLISTHLPDSFVRSAPILKDDEIVRDWLRQVIRRETDTQMILEPEVPETDRLLFFDQNPGKRCSWCVFAPTCWSGLSIEDLDLKPREDHHKPKEAKRLDNIIPAADTEGGS
jgi:hypothetical protein